MFGFGKKKLSVGAVVPGRVIDIAEVPDAVFSSKMMGDGYAVEPAQDEILAPCDGQVVLVADTLHALALEKDGVQLLIHMGLDTVELGGRGFEVLVQQGDPVKRGAVLARMDRGYVASQGKDTIVLVVLTNMAEKVASLAKNLTDPEALLSIQVK